MPRAPRIEFAGAIYHVMNRGNHLDPIFRDDIDRKLFLKTLAETCMSAEWLVHSFVFMRNHYHLLIETCRPNLVKGMQYLNCAYTRRYNVRHKTFGHLFQGRYKALLVDVENKGYFLTVSDYVHLNPIRAKIVNDFQNLLHDPWSSLGWIAGTRRKRPDWVVWDRVYAELGLKGWERSARREFRQYIERRVGEEIKLDKNKKHQKIQRGWCLGSEEFVDRMKERLEKLSSNKHEERWNDASVEEMEEERAKKFLIKGIKCLGYYHVNEVQGLDRFLLARWIRLYTKVNVKWLADQFGMKTRGGMSNGIYLVARKIELNKKIYYKWKALEKVYDDN